MANNICPNCHQEYWNWFFDDEIPPPWGTVNSCNNCQYCAYEDESKQEDCPQCKAASSFGYYKDDEKEFQYCCWCTYKKIVKLIDAPEPD